MRSRWSPEQHAGLVAGEHPPAPCAVRTASAHRSASGSRAIARSAPRSAASASSASVAPGSSGFGKATVGKSGSGAACEATTCTSVKPARCSACTAVAPPTPCIGVSATRSVRAVAAGQPRDPFQVGVGDVDLGRRRGRRDRDGAGRRGDGGLDLGVGRRGELRAVGEVDLVAVVGGWVVRGRDLDPGHGAQLADREGEHRRRQRAGQHPHREPGPGQHLRRRGRERREAALRRRRAVLARRRGPTPSHPGAGARSSSARLPRRRSRSSRPARPSPAARRRRSCPRARPAPGRAGPAVPKRSIPDMRSASSSTAPAVPTIAAASTRCSSDAGGRVRVVGDPAQRRVAQVRGQGHDARRSGRAAARPSARPRRRPRPAPRGGRAAHRSSRRPGS